MKFKSSGAQKVEIDMTPMIDIVFQLLTFFLFNLKIVAPEGNFNINMPMGGNQAAASDSINTPDIKVGLRSDTQGRLISLSIGGRNLGNDDAAFERLQREILTIIGNPGNPNSKEVAVEIDADYECKYEYVIRAVSKCTGKMDPGKKEMVRYVEKIKFAKPHSPKRAGE
jgi:biopolymer transport protein ExbD